MKSSTNLAYSNDEHNHDDHNHTHESGNHSHDKQKKTCFKLTKTQSLIIMLIMTFLFFFAEIIVGNITKSNALIADSFHMLSDVIALVIGLVAVRMSKRSSSRNTYGWVRAEILGSLVNAVFLLALCFSIIVEAINRFVNPEPIERVELMLIIAGVGLGINLIGMLIFGLHGHEHGHSHSHSHKKDVEIGSIILENTSTTTTTVGKITKIKKARNMNMNGVFLHVLSDALGSVAVMISGLIVKFAPPVDDATVKWKLYIDPALSFVISILITISTVPLLKEASLVLLQTVPSQFKIDELETLIKSVKGVLDVHHLHVWSLNSEKIIASAHVRVIRQDNNEELVIMHEIKRLLHKNDIHSTTVQLEYESNFFEHNYDFCEGKECRKRQCCTNEQIKLIDDSTRL
jgi:zinc transporter 1